MRRRSQENITRVMLFLLLGEAMKRLPKQLRKIEIPERCLELAIAHQKRGVRIGWKLNESGYDRKFVAIFGDKITMQQAGITGEIQIDMTALTGHKRVFDLK